MADITKRTAKRLAASLEPGEQVEAAVLIEAKGTYGPGMVGLAVLPRTMTKVLENRASEDNTTEGGLAARVPGKSSVLVITDRRVLFARSNGLKFEAPEFELDRAQITLGSMERKGFGRRLQLVFSDGSAVRVDGQLGQPYKQLEELIGRTETPVVLS